MKKHIAPHFLTIATWALFCSTQIFADTMPVMQSPQDVNPAVKLYQSPVSDPLNGFNRGMESVNSFCARRIIYPVGSAYNHVVPNCISKGIHNFGTNLLFPLRFATNCLQGKFSDAWEETERFAINTTVGIVGVRDQAAVWGYMPHKEDFGQTFATWGIGSGWYLNLPFFGPTTVRDGVGSIVGIPFNIAFWLGDASMPINLTVRANDTFRSADFLYNYFGTGSNTYPLTRAATILSREADIKDNIFSDCPPDADDALGYAALAPKDKTFARQASVRSVVIPETGMSLSYNWWPQNSPNSRILFLLPGIGTHRNSLQMCAMAELAFNAGWSVAIVSSTFHPEFFIPVSQTLPGILEKDTAHLDNALSLILNNIQSSSSQFDAPAETAVLGLSLGAINTLRLAQLAHNGKAKFTAGRYVAINPPRNPLKALDTLDKFFNIPLSWPANSRDDKCRETLQRLAGLLQADRQNMSMPNLTREESLFVIGFNSRLLLSDIAYTIRNLPEHSPLSKAWPEQRDSNIPLDTRDARALACPFKAYLENILLPFAKSMNQVPANADVNVLASQMTLDTVIEDLINTQNVFVFHNENDFLLAPDDIAWFKKTLGNRFFAFPRGSHLGNLFLPNVQEAIQNALK